MCFLPPALHRPQRSEHRRWLRLLGLEHDVQIWSATPPKWAAAHPAHGVGAAGKLLGRAKLKTLGMAGKAGSNLLGAEWANAALKEIGETTPLVATCEQVAIAPSE